ncbi:MAG: PPC domain-containing protein [Paludibacteraceae bacterium]|nr:PPC domain-containing protein [Paludibacteraceae bacterium]
MKNYFFIIALSLSALLLSCHKSAEQTANSEEKTEVAQPSTALQTLRMAYDLARYGYETESAMALIEAADILVAVPSVEMDSVVVEKGSVSATDDKADKAPITPAQLLIDAKEFAGDNEHLLALIVDVERKLTASSEVTRGAMPGKDAPIEHHDRVLAHDTDVYSLHLTEGKLFEAAIIGDGDTDLELYVYDPEGKQVITEDTYQPIDCYIRFTPAASGIYTLKIVNTGNVYNNYVLLTN